MIEMIARVDDKAVLRHLYEVVSEILSHTWSEDYELTPEQEAQLNADIEASLHPENLVDHEAAIQKMSRWLKQ
ncbi:MAG: hypothetical protein HY842_16695 [Bacteroidetes bacterium]|nr:hypothetical protein [Bacteroidota bacterium]